MRPPLAAAGLLALVVVGSRLRRRRYDLAGKVVLITGGGRGLGLQVAREAAARGAVLALVARHGDELAAARRELEATGAKVATAECDVRDEAAVARALETVRAELGAVDVLVNLAGIIGVGPIEALTFADFYEAVDVNYFGAVRMTLAVLPEMRARGAGRIVNVTSIGGEIAVPHLLPYCASKFAFVGFSDGLRAEVARDGVSVVTVIPGLMRTGSPPQATFAGQPEKEYAAFALSDATPATSVSVEHAARTVLDGVERGKKRIVISWQARAALLLRGIAPGLVLKLMTLAGYALPDAGERPEHRSGRASESPITQSPLTALSRHATETQHETIHPPSP